MFACDGVVIVGMIAAFCLAGIIIQLFAWRIYGFAEVLWSRTGVYFGRTFAGKKYLEESVLQDVVSM